MVTICMQKSIKQPRVNMDISVNKINTDKWEKKIVDNSYSTPFQTPEFYNFFNSIPNSSANVYAAEENNSIVALCVVTMQKEKGVKGYFSRRAIIYGGVLTEKTNVQALEKLLEYINDDLRSKAIYIEIRNYKDYKLFAEVFQKNKWEYVPYLNYQHQFNGQTLDELISKMKYNRRREIKLSFKEGAMYGEAKNEAEIKELYKILFDLYQNRVKLPLPDVSYFLNLFHSPIGKVFVVKHNEKVIGGSFCALYQGLYIYTIYYCGLREYDKKIFPTHLAIIAAMEYGINNGFAGLDLMGAGKPDEEYGVRSYKAEFGGELVEHGRFIKIVNPFLYRVGKTGLEILKRIKK